MAILIYLKLSSLRRRPFCLHLFVFNQRRLSYKCDISIGGALKIDTNIESCLVFNSLQRLAPQIDGHVNLLCDKGRCYTISACLVPEKKNLICFKITTPHLTQKNRPRQRAAPASESPPKTRPAVGIIANMFTWEWNIFRSKLFVFRLFFVSPGLPSPHQWPPLHQTKGLAGKLLGVFQRKARCWGSGAAGWLSAVASAPSKEYIKGIFHKKKFFL